MNDTELDEMLNQWEAPEVPARLRDSIVLPRPPKRRIAWPSWHLSKGLFAGLAAGAAMCFIGITAAFPQALGPTPRFSLSSELLSHHDDGTVSVWETRTSTARNGAEIILERNMPDDFRMSLHLHFFDAIHRFFGISEQPPPSMASDCSFPLMSVIGHETILNYKTTVQREMDQDGSRYTEWRAPQLDCIVMKYIAEKPVNGQFQITRERRPLTVQINHAQ